MNLPTHPKGLFSLAANLPNSLKELLESPNAESSQCWFMAVDRYCGIILLITRRATKGATSRERDGQEENLSPLPLDASEKELVTVFEALRPFKLLLPER